MDSNRVDWDLWGKLRAVELWQAVCLSLGRTPEKQFVEQDSDARRRLEIACNHMTSGAGSLRWQQLGPDLSDHDPENIVLLADFRAWVQEIGWEIPPELKDGGHKSTAVAAPSHWPWGDHHTMLLGHLAAAAREFWVNYDPNNARTTAPKNATVVDWLKTERKTSDVMAKAIATMLRPDDLPTGPRK